MTLTHFSDESHLDESIFVEQYLLISHTEELAVSSVLELLLLFHLLVQVPLNKIFGLFLLGAKVFGIDEVWDLNRGVTGLFFAQNGVSLLTDASRVLVDHLLIVLHLNPVKLLLPVIFVQFLLLVSRCLSFLSDFPSIQVVLHFKLL